MTTGVDTNVLIDVLARDVEFWESSMQALLDASDLGAVLVSEPVYAEVASRFDDLSELNGFLHSVGAALHPSSSLSLHAAGHAWNRYLSARRSDFGCPNCSAAVQVRCDQCGTLVTRRQHVLADFIIGAHAQVHAGRLLTRDRGYYRTYFPDLILV